MADLESELFNENARTAPATDARKYVTVGAWKEVPEVTVAYETWGELNKDGTNAVLIQHALSGDSHAVGWWDRLVGPGLAIDTNRYFVIGHNMLGGCQGTTGPSSLAPDGKPWGSRFPKVSVEDMVDIQERFVAALGIKELYAVAGGSMGGMVALEWARRSTAQAKIPVRKAFITASACAHGAMQIGFNEAARQAIFRDPNYNGGDYYEGEPPRDGLSVARMVGHLSYLSSAAFDLKFGRRRQVPRIQDRGSRAEVFEVESYLSYQGDKFTDRFDANSLVVLSSAIDAYSCESLEGCQTEFCVVSFTSDWIYPSSLSAALHELALKHGCKSRWEEIDMPWGHDSFLLDGEVQGEIVRKFLG